MVNPLSDVYRRCLDLIVDRLFHAAKDVLWLGLKGIRTPGLDNVHRLVGDAVHPNNHRGQHDLDGLGSLQGGGGNALGVCVGVAGKGVGGQGVVDNDQGR